MKFWLCLAVLTLAGCAGHRINSESVSVLDQTVISTRWNAAAQAPYSASWAGLSDVEILANVRALPYKKDPPGLDLWQPADVTAKHGGDCDDKTILLYKELKAAGYSQMRAAVVFTKKGDGHMVLVMPKNGMDYIYDTINPSGKPYRAAKSHYKPVYEIEADTGLTGIFKEWE